MVKLRIVNGIPEIDGTCDEIAEMMQKLNMNVQRLPSTISSELETPAFSEVGNPNAHEIVELIEERGFPISFTMADIQKKQYGRTISSTDDKQKYEKYHRECEKARKLLQKKYGGRWDSEITTVDGKYVKRYKLLEASRMK